MKITADGRARQHFWGEYYATIALGFPSKEDAELVLPLLRHDWKLGEKTGKALVIFVGNDLVDEVIEDLVKFGAEKEKILSLKHSVDLGELFTCNFEVEDSRQERLF